MMPRRRRLDGLAALVILIFLATLAITALMIWLTPGSAAPERSAAPPHRAVVFTPDRAQRPVARAIAALEAAIDRGDVVALCSPGRLATKAVVRALDGDPGSCAGEVGARLAGLHGDVDLAIRAIAPREDFAVAEVVGSADAAQSSRRIAFLRDRGRWLLTFGDTGNPLVELFP
jgi:hypothetical protein